jgi:hypothetical protein
MYKVIFKYQEQAYIYSKLLTAVNKLCEDKKQNANCVSGYRSPECQKATNLSVLNQSKSNRQVTDPKNSMYGAVYDKDGTCIAGAYGKSNHCFCIAMDIDSLWFKSLTNAQLKPYGLYKPILPKEPWHVQLIELDGITQTQKETIRDGVLKEKDKLMNVKEFQAMTGLTADGIVGSKTIAKAKEMLEIINKILKGGK